jgi:hypothetical protein
LSIRTLISNQESQMVSIFKKDSLFRGQEESPWYPVENFRKKRH